MENHPAPTHQTDIAAGLFYNCIKVMSEYIFKFYEAERFSHVSHDTLQAGIFNHLNSLKDTE